MELFLKLFLLLDEFSDVLLRRLVLVVDIFLVFDGLFVSNNCAIMGKLNSGQLMNVLLMLSNSECRGLPKTLIIIFMSCNPCSELISLFPVVDISMILSCLLSF